MAWSFQHQIMDLKTILILAWVIKPLSKRDSTSNNGAADAAWVGPCPICDPPSYPPPFRRRIDGANFGTPSLLRNRAASGSSLNASATSVLNSRTRSSCDGCAANACAAFSPNPLANSSSFERRCRLSLKRSSYLVRFELFV